jgi:hypothetical protein
MSERSSGKEGIIIYFQILCGRQKSKAEMRHEISYVNATENLNGDVSFCILPDSFTGFRNSLKNSTYISFAKTYVFMRHFNTIKLSKGSDVR